MLPSNSEALNELKTRLAGSGLAALLENIRTLTVLLDSRGTLAGWNRAFDLIRQGLPGSAKLQDFLSPPARPEFQRSIHGVLETGKPARMRLEIGSRSKGSAYECVVVPQSEGHVLFIGEPDPSAGPTDLPTAVGELQQLKVQLQETQLALEMKRTELKAVLAQTDEVVHTDALTLLPNRRWIIADLQQQVTYSERYGAPLSISMVDLDYFKDVNDNFGHAAGDQVLRFIASEMRERIRKPDVIGRYGGDEFLVILPNTPLPAAAEQAARLCQQVSATPVLSGKEEIRVTLSIGLAQYKAGDDWRALLERADQALYQAKNSGRGQWAILEA
jgi:diguanylate cyclase (GGDEF)-like protein